MARLIDADGLKMRMRAFATAVRGTFLSIEAILDRIDTQPTVDAVVMPKGKPGDYLEWDNGTGFKQIYRIYAVSFCENYVRYDLDKFSPAVDHPNIVQIMSLDEAEKEWREMCAKAVPREEPTLTAVYGERKNNG